MYGISGACIAGVPLALLLAIQSYNNASLNRQLNRCRELERSGLYLNVWVLNKDISAGEKIKKSDIEKQKKWVSEKDDISTADMSQISGKRAKESLKKGTVLEIEMFYQKNIKKHKDRKSE